jgi:hypothetical protein
VKYRTPAGHLGVAADGAPIYVILDNLSANKTPMIRARAARNKVELCLTPTSASWAKPIEAQFGPLRIFTMANSNTRTTPAWPASCRNGCAGATPTPAIPTSSQHNAANEPGSAANANSAGGDAERKPPDRSDPVNVRGQRTRSAAGMGQPYWTPAQSAAANMPASGVRAAGFAHRSCRAGARVSRQEVRGRAILREALSHFAHRGGGSLKEFIDLLADLPEDVASLERSVDIASDMAQTLTAACINDPLFGGSGTPLDPGVLLTPSLGRRARVSVISMIGLSSEEQRQSFVNQLQMGLMTWIEPTRRGTARLAGCW